MLPTARSRFSYRVLESTTSASLRRYFRPKYQLRRLATSPDGQNPGSHLKKAQQDESTSSKISRALKEASSTNNSLLAPVHIAEDAHAILKERHPAASILANSTVVVTRDMEMMNVMMGYEEANKYSIMDAQGNHIGYMAEEELGLGRMMTRQLFRTHRAFTTHIFDRHMKEVLRFHRPFSYINSNIGVYDPIEATARSRARPGEVKPNNHVDLSTQVGQTTPETSSLAISEMRLIGEARQEWAPLRRKYNLFFSRPAESTAAFSETSAVLEQFARVDAPFLSWDFPLHGASGDMIGSVSRNWTNIGRELFTDAGCYALRMDSAMPIDESQQTNGMRTELVPHSGSLTLDQRAVMLATAVTVDYDYFSRERSGFFGGMPLWMGGAGGAAEGAGAGAAGAAGAVGAGEAAAGVAGAEVAGAAAAGGVARGAASGAAGVGEGAIAGAGSLGAYEAMQRATESGQSDDASPMADETSPQSPENGAYPQQGQDQGQWWDQQPPQQGQDEGWGVGERNNQDGEGGGITDWLNDFFDDE